MSSETPNYYAIIPASIRYDKDLPANAKLLYGEITALANKKGICWATNGYFANLYQVSNKTISLWIKKLAEKNYIKSTIIYKEGSKEIINRYLQIGSYPIEEKVNTPMEEKVKDNNTRSNNTRSNNTRSNNTRSNNTRSNNTITKDIVYFLNLETKSKYSATNKKTISLINARLNDGFTFEDFKKVISIKTKEWLNTNMSNYLRPETLFGTKFESYLNQKEAKHNNTPTPTTESSMNAYRKLQEAKEQFTFIDAEVV